MAVCVQREGRRFAARRLLDVCAAHADLHLVSVDDGNDAAATIGKRRFQRGQWSAHISMHSRASIGGGDDASRPLATVVRASAAIGTSALTPAAEL